MFAVVGTLVYLAVRTKRSKQVAVRQAATTMAKDLQMAAEMNKHLLISGCSTGIGRACALHFSKNGYHVFAGVRKASDAESLEAADHSGNLEPVMLDVTNDTQLSELKATLNSRLGDVGLAGLINNAGIARGGPLEYADPQDMHDMFNVNVMGPVLLTQAFLPLLRIAKGRIVMVSSVAGKLPLALMGAYNISKSGLEAFNDTLRQELAPHGIHVSLIAPGPIETPLLQSSDSGFQEVLDSLGKEGKVRYGELIQKFRVYFQTAQRNALPPQAVADAIEHALESDRPKTRYLVTKEAKLAYFFRWALSDRALDYVMSKSI